MYYIFFIILINIFSNTKFEILNVLLNKKNLLSQEQSIKPLKCESTIYIFGEKHNDKDTQYLKKLKQGALNKKIILATEGSTFKDNEDNKNKYSFGYEDDFSFIYASAPMDYYYIYGGIKTNDDDLINNLVKNKVMFLIKFSIYKFYQNSWKNLKKELSKDPKFGTFVEIIDYIVTNQDNEDLVLKQLQKHYDYIIDPNNNELFIELTKKNALVFLAYSKEFTKEKNIPDSSYYENFVNNPTNIDSKSEFLDVVVNNWRNIFIYNNLVKIYNLACEKNIDLYVVIGTSHIKGLNDMLSKRYTVKYIVNKYVELKK